MHPAPSPTKPHQSCPTHPPMRAPPRPSLINLKQISNIITSFIHKYFTTITVHHIQGDGSESDSFVWEVLMEGWLPLAPARAGHLRCQGKHSPQPPGAHARGWVCRNGGREQIQATAPSTL